MSKPSWEPYSKDLNPGLHIRQWRDAITGERQYELVRVIVCDVGYGVYLSVQDADYNTLTDHQLNSSNFLSIAE